MNKVKVSLDAHKVNLKQFIMLMPGMQSSTEWHNGDNTFYMTGKIRLSDQFAITLYSETYGTSLKLAKDVVTGR